MANMNLYQAGDGGIKKSSKSFSMDGGFFFSVGIFLLVLLALGGAKLANSSFKEKGDVLNQEMESVSAGFSGSDVDRIMDFQTRIERAVENISSKPDGQVIFPAIEGFMVQGVSAKSVSYTKGGGPLKLDMVFSANDFWSVAKQILSIKESGKFSNVAVSAISRGERDISFSVSANLK